MVKHALGMYNYRRIPIEQMPTPENYAWLNMASGAVTHCVPLGEPHPRTGTRFAKKGWPSLCGRYVRDAWGWRPPYQGVVAWPCPKCEAAATEMMQ